MSNVALLVVFNHRFDRNLEKLRSFYRTKFSNVFFLMPFYDGTDEDVIPVYYPSNTFQGFFVHAYEKLKGYGFEGWFVIADDMVINPCLDENNIKEKLGVDQDKSFLPSIIDFNPEVDWIHAYKSLSFSLHNPFLENFQQLPDKQVAFNKLKTYGLEPKGLMFDKIYKDIFSGDKEKSTAFYGLRYVKDTAKYKDELLLGEYPLCWGYSDIFFIGGNNLKEFCRLCGIFAASGLFVEIALPTALVLATKGKVIQQHQIEYRGRPLWGEEVDEYLGKYNYNLQNLCDDFPVNQLFWHPVKLSKWN